MIKILFITLGDPYSINLSCLNKVLSRSNNMNSYATVFVGSYFYFKRQASEYLQKEAVLIRSLKNISKSGFYFIDIGLKFDKSENNLTQKERGEISVKSLDFLQKVSFDRYSKSAVLTSPIDKKAAFLAGFKYPGHTEYFEDLWRKKGIMILAGPRLRVGLVTNHLAIKDVAKNITKEQIIEKAIKFYTALKQDFSIVSPKIAICSLNPHGSDHGLFGNEEELIIDPALKELQKKFPKCFPGVYPADTAFFQGYHNKFDGVLAMYHDQGLGPLKTVHFYDGINVTGALPYLRVSPDHGPAIDLFNSGKENTDSFDLAYRFCLRYLSD